MKTGASKNKNVSTELVVSSRIVGALTIYSSIAIASIVLNSNGHIPMILIAISMIYLVSGVGCIANTVKGGKYIAADRKGQEFIIFFCLSLDMLFVLCGVIVIINPLILMSF